MYVPRMMAQAKEILLQTRVTVDQHQAIEAAASERGLSIAAFLRVCAMQRAKSTIVRAWVTEYGRDPSSVLNYDLAPHYVLERIGAGANGEQAFAMYTVDVRSVVVPVSRSAITFEADFLQRPERHQFLLDGSTQRWFVVRTTFNAGANLVEIVLRPENTAADRIRRRVYDARDGLLVFDLLGGTQIRGRVDVLAIGVDSCEVRVENAQSRTVPYASVLAVGSAQ